MKEEKNNETLHSAEVELDELQVLEDNRQRSSDWNLVETYELYVCEGFPSLSLHRPSTCPLPLLCCYGCRTLHVFATIST